jgi:hypothetical protein
MTTNDCTICCEKFNMSTRKCVKCPYCEIETCLICFKKYIIGLVSATPECMGCHKQLTLDFITESTPKVFHNTEYRQARANILLSKEKSLLPDTQYLVEHKKNQNLLDEVIKNIELKHKDLLYLKRLISKQKKELDIKQKELDIDIYNINQEKRDIVHQRNTNHIVKEPKKQFIMGCPVEECRGFLSQAWKCGLCEVYVCSKCRCLKECRDDNTHICDPDTLATVNMMKTETRACPSCSVPIFKISGCPQMWCTSCHTTFCWNTGRIETGTVHNPHFYQWQRDTNNGVAPRVPGDNQCEICPTYLTILEKNIIYKDNYNIKHLENMHRAIYHIRHVILPIYPLTNGQNDNSDLRVMFLMNEINECQWLKLLQHRQKKSEKSHDIHQILDMLRTSLIDMFTIYNQRSIDVILEGVTLRNYVNTELIKIGIKYKSVTPFVTVDWGLKTIST